MQEGQKYAQYDIDGNIIGFFSSEIHSNIPINTIPITFDEWQKCLAEQGDWKVDPFNKILIKAP